MLVWQRLGDKEKSFRTGKKGSSALSEGEGSCLMPFCPVGMWPWHVAQMLLLLGELEGCRWGVGECKPFIWLGGQNPQVQMFAGCQNSDMGQTQALSNVSCKNYARRDVYTLVPSSYSLACRCLLRADPALLLDCAEWNLNWLSHCLSSRLNMIVAFYPCLSLSALCPKWK